MKSRVLTILLFISSVAQAQFTWAEIGIDGLTCSMCARSVDLSIRKLDAVQDVQMDLEATTAKVIFHKGSHIDMGKLADAVTNSGFSVRDLHAAFVFDNLEAADGKRFVYDGSEYEFIRAEKKTLKGETLLKFIGKPFLSKKELAEWKPKLPKDPAQPTGNLYFVSLQ
jgi:copper chaperone CopZ